MLVLKNDNRVMGEGGKPLVNKDINALKTENADRITIGLVTTGPIALSWGDGTTLNLGTQAIKYNASKLYSSVGTWNISITNPENVISLSLDNLVGYGGVDKINTPVGWLAQFSNLQILNLKTATLRGSLSTIVKNALLKLTSLTYYQPLNSTMYNVSDTVDFWRRCTYVDFGIWGVPTISGVLDDVSVNIACQYFRLSQNTIGGNISGILKNGYTLITKLTIGTSSCIISENQKLDDIILPSTTVEFSLNNCTNAGKLESFNFNKLRCFTVTANFDYIDLSGNSSFPEFGATAEIFSIKNTRLSSVKIPINVFTSSNLYDLSIGTQDGCSDVYGDIATMYANVKLNLILSGKNDNKITGNINASFKGNTLSLTNVNADMTASDLKTLCMIATPTFNGVSGVSGNIDSIYFKTNNSNYWLSLRNMQNLSGDITTFQFGTWYNTLYQHIYFSGNSQFTGNLANLTLWANKSTVDLSNCAYTNVSGFVRKVFTNRNTCLKATGGMTNIYVQGNVDNSSLTGIEQQPPLGSYAGNVNDLTEAQIDNLSLGKDHTGTGTSTPWTDKELIWIMSKLKNSSTDSSLRYRSTWSY